MCRLEKNPASEKLTAPGGIQCRRWVQAKQRLPHAASSTAREVRNQRRPSGSPVNHPRPALAKRDHLALRPEPKAAARDDVACEAAGFPRHQRHLVPDHESATHWQQLDQMSETGARIAYALFQERLREERGAMEIRVVLGSDA